jgi:hypothetical protein
MACFLFWGQVNVRIGSGSAGGFELADVLGADLDCGVEGEEWSALRGCFDGGTAVGLLALDDADYGGNDHAGFARCFDGVDGGGAGGTYVVDDHDACAFATEAFNAATGPMCLFGFAYEEAVEQGSARILLRAPCAGGCDVGDDGICAHGESADGLRIDVILFQKFKHGVPGEAAAFGVKRGGAAVNVVVAGAAGGELELAELEAGAGEEGEKLLGVGGHQCDCKGQNRELSPL